MMRFFSILMFLAMWIFSHSFAIAEGEMWHAGVGNAYARRVILHPSSGNSVIQFYRYLDILGLWRFSGVFKSREPEFSHLESNQYVQSLEDLVARWIYHQRNAILLSEAMFQKFYSDSSSNPLPRFGLRIEELRFVMAAHKWAKFSAAENFWKPCGSSNVSEHPIFSLAGGYGRTWTAEEKGRLGAFDRVDQEEQHRRIVEISNQILNSNGQFLSYTEKGELIQFLEHSGDVVERWGSKGGESPEGRGIGREEYRNPAYSLEKDPLLRVLFTSNSNQSLPPHLSRQAQVNWLKDNYHSIIGDYVSEDGHLAVFLEIEKWESTYFELVRAGNTSWRESSGMSLSASNRKSGGLISYQPSPGHRAEFFQGVKCISSLSLPH